MSYEFAIGAVAGALIVCVVVVAWLVVDEWRQIKAARTSSDDRYSDAPVRAGTIVGGVVVDNAPDGYKVKRVASRCMRLALAAAEATGDRKRELKAELGVQTIRLQSLGVDKPKSIADLMRLAG